jgi:hypothetical protein
LTLVACIFVKYDFPAKWMQLNAWLIKTFDDIFNNLHNLTEEVVPKINRFLGFYIDIMKE